MDVDLLDRGIALLLRHGIALGFCFLASILLLVSIFRRNFSIRMLSGCLLAGWGIGALAVPEETGVWIGLSAAAILFLAFIALLFAHVWSFGAATALGALVFVGLGATFGGELQSLAVFLIRAIRSLIFLYPERIALLILLPWVVWISRKSLAGLSSGRRKLVIAMRCLVITLLAAAIAEPRLRREDEGLTVLFVIDRSLSIPQEEINTADAPESPRDLRWERVREFIDLAIRSRGFAHRTDKVGVILFARKPRLILPPASVDRLLVDERLAGFFDASYTDIGAAIKQALASFPAGSAKRIVLLSDGNENLGNAENQAAFAARTEGGIPIDTIALAAGYRRENEVLIKTIDVPPLSPQGVKLPITVVLRNNHPARMVRGTLEVVQERAEFRFDQANRVEVALETSRGVRIRPSPNVIRVRGNVADVVLNPGLTSFSFLDEEAASRPFDASKVESTTYRARFIPLGSQALDGSASVDGHYGDRLQNNTASALSIARNKGMILFLEAGGEEGSWPHQSLIDLLRQRQFRVVPLKVERLRSLTDGQQFSQFLSAFDCVVLGNIPAESLTDGQREILQANTGEQGCGLVMLGGPDSFGAGGYQNTPIETALPVKCELNALQVATKGGLVLVMHASEMQDGNRWQKEIAKLAVERLNSIDMFGLLYFDFVTKWHIAFQQIGNSKRTFQQSIDRMNPGDMPDFDSALKLAADTLADAKHELGRKHVIIISDGDPQISKVGTDALQKMRENEITCTTVGVATHGPAEDQRMKQIALSAAPGGKFEMVNDPSQLPAIYIRESRRVSQAFQYERRFTPTLRKAEGATAGMTAAEIRSLDGFIRTTLKPTGATMQLAGPSVEDQEFPVLASWNYGLGRATAFTSSAHDGLGEKKRRIWDAPWRSWEKYARFWEQLFVSTMRGEEKGRLAITTELRDGRVLVRVDARSETNKPLADLIVRGKVSAVGAGGQVVATDLAFEAAAGGVYEADFKAEEAATYLINVAAYDDQGNRVDSARSGYVLPYSPEFGDEGANVELLKRIAALTGGEFFTEDQLFDLARSGRLFRPAPKGTRDLLPFWFWLTFAAGCLWVVDIALRRISIEWEAIRTWLSQRWRALRAQYAASEETPDYLKRLRERKAGVSETIERSKTVRRFSSSDAPAVPPDPSGADAASEPPSLPPPPRPQAESPSTEDFAARLRKAKKRAGFDKPTDPPTSQ